MYFNLIKCLLACQYLFKLLIFLYSFYKQVYNFTKVLNKALVIVYKTNKYLYLFNGLRLYLFFNYSHFSWLYSNFTQLDNIFKKFYFPYIENTLLQVNKQVHLLQFYKNLMNILLILLLILKVNKNIIKVYNYKYIKVFLKYIINYSLKYSQGISKPKRYN